MDGMLNLAIDYLIIHSKKDFAAFNLPFNQSEFANHVKSLCGKELGGETGEKFKRSNVVGGGNDSN